MLKDRVSAAGPFASPAASPPPRLPHPLILRFPMASQRLGWSPLDVASHDGHTEVVQALLNAGALVDLSEIEDGATALYIACQNGHLDVVRALLKHGASARKTKVGAVTDSQRLLSSSYPPPPAHTHIHIHAHTNLHSRHVDDASTLAETQRPLSSCTRELAPSNSAMESDPGEGSTKFLTFLLLPGGRRLALVHRMSKRPC